MRTRSAFAILAFFLIFASHSADARTVKTERVRTVQPPIGATDNPALVENRGGLAAAASAPETTWLHSANFDAGALCSAMGWTSVDLTAPLGDYWHIEDYAGLAFGPLEGSKSLWLGARPGNTYVLCGYAALPGYGNGWNQSWCTKDCLATTGGPTPQLDVSFALKFDSEPSYDGTTLEYTNDCAGNAGWTEIDGGITAAGWSGTGQVSVAGHYSVNPGPVKVRLHFRSDTAWSDQDGFYNTVAGAAHVDSLQAESLPIELFEDETVGATSSNDWQSCNTPGFGNYAGLMKGSSVLQEDPCVSDFSCLWAFIQGSAFNYACGGHPEQKVVPFGANSRGEYISNEIWSPSIALTGSGSILNLQFDVYKDLPLDNIVFYVWHVRSIVNGCPTPWADRNFVFYGDSKTWFHHVEDIGTKVNMSTATNVQVAIGVLDMCPFWCGVFGTGACHSQAPLIDNVKVYRVNIEGPHWDVRDIDTFQDNFAANGTITGTARADEANDIRGWQSSSFVPGDSAIVLYLLDPTYAVGAGTDASGLSNDPNLSTFIGRHKTKKQVYLWVAVWPPDNVDNPGDKVGADLSEGPGGQANRYPFAGTQVIDGVLWTKIRFDYTYTGTSTNPGNGHPAPSAPPFVSNRFNVDLNDNLFTPGDTVCYFYSATSPGGTTYWSYNWRATSDISEVAANPMEFTILPAGGFNRGGHTLYVDGADGLGDQPYFDGAFVALGLAGKVDRYDVRAPSSGLGNRPSSRVKNVQQQLNNCYTSILWDCGSLSVTLGDGTDSPEKSDDYKMLNTFLANLTGPGGVYLCGDDVAEQLIDYNGAGAVSFRTNHMPFTLTSGSHQQKGLGVSPQVFPWPGRCFNDAFVAYGGCPEFNHFDVLSPSGTSLIEMSYTTPQNTFGAVLSHVNGNARVMLSGFSFAYIRDDETNGISDRAQHMHDILTWLGAATGPATSAGPALRTSLAQNYPNPFNPQTTIAFSIAQRADVRLAIYDVNGALVRTLANESRAPGAYQLTWDGRNDRGASVASGVYFYRLTAGSFTQTKKMVLLK